MNSNSYDWQAKSKQVKEVYGLRHRPDILSNRTAAFEWANGVKKLHFVILGDDCKFWVVCPADASRLIKAGYEYAK